MADEALRVGSVGGVENGLALLANGLPHYASHVGQIMYQAKIIKGNEFKSLSIPKGKSDEFNKEKFSEEKSRRHFTDGLK